VFRNIERDFVLREPRANLWAAVREDAIDYFTRNRIGWWNGVDDGPTGHLLSSQVACVNHLYPLRQRPDCATAVLNSLDPEIVTAERVDDGFVAFEFIGERPYLKERSFTRGAHCTSVDAAMMGRTAAGTRRAFLIEWKYTELYARENKYVPARATVYDPLIVDPYSPFAGVDPAALYFEPFYQLMRQTLLGWLMARHEDHGCTSWRHVHVVPASNRDLLDRVTAPGLEGADIHAAWRRVLVDPSSFLVSTPADLLSPLSGCADTLAHRTYLADRYGGGA
jgi:hypothetical protein